MMITRRDLLAMGALTAVGAATLPPALRAESSRRFHTLPAALAALEKVNTGRLGVAVFDTGSGERSGYRADQRFALCSTFKMLLAAAVLERADGGREHLDRAIAVPARPLIGNSPLTEEHAGGQMTVSALCHAILTRSDNTAANLLLETLGGPDGITRFARSIGDTVTRLDRTETSLNEARPGDPRDTTSPRAMVGNLRTLLLGDVLAPGSREQLTQWMIANKTGEVRLRARLPQDWRAGDKTGSNLKDTANDIAILWPAHGAPVLVAAYLTECAGPEDTRNAVLAEVGRLIAASFRAA
jgi:beta-lactamase class A